MAIRIFEKLGSRTAAIHDLVETSLAETMNYRNLILGIPTWGIGEMQDDWLLALPALAILGQTEE